MSLRRPAKNQPETFEFSSSSMEEAKKIVEANNILYIENKCTKIEFEKYFN